MTKNAEDIAKLALGFPTSDRAYLAELLLESLEWEEDFEISQEWMDEIKKRCRQIDNGEVELIDGETAITLPRS